MKLLVNRFPLILLILWALSFMEANASPAAAANGKTVADIIKRNKVIREVTDSFSKEELNQLRRNPGSVLNEFPKGGPKMAKYIARVAMADPKLIESMVNATELASPDQASAIGAGLARAARLLSGDQLSNINNRAFNARNINTRITYKAIGKLYGPQDRAILKPVEIGFWDGAAGGTDLYGNELQATVGSNNDFFQQGSLQNSFFEENFKSFDDFFESPQAAASFVASSAEDNGAFSTSPTQ
jgi:hypothetical protein